MATETASRQAQGRRKRNKPQKKPVKEGSSEEVLLAEVQQLLEASKHQESQDVQCDFILPEKFSEIEVPITYLSSTGDGLGLSADRKHVYVVPFTLPGDVARAKIISSRPTDRYTVTDFLGIKQTTSKRDESLIQCQYFSRCSGCQLQMLSYEDQLNHKKAIIERAYKQFSNVAPEHIPAVRDTMPSPLQFGYRTKLTPHFDGPPGSNRKKGSKLASLPTFTEAPPIGFNLKNQRKVLDVEDCPIATQPLRAGLKIERTRIAHEISKYKRGATLLLRETTTREPVAERVLPDSADNTDTAVTTLRASSPEYTETKTYTTDNNGYSTEYVDGFVFYNIAGAFFQNNNSILPKITQYIRENILHSDLSEPSHPASSSPEIINLLDAYCGSGFFTITLSSLFKKSIGIDISESSIQCARKNAEANATQNTRFIAATASKIFAGLDVQPDCTAVVIDPPRKGCDEDFLKQLLDFGPRRIVYVSCNVHTQARDVGVLVEGRSTASKNHRRYKIESIRGFDFFPQTGHVESVAVLDRVELG